MDAAGDAGRAHPGRRAGIRFLHPTGYGTAGGGKETRQIDGRWYVLEKPLKADFAFVKAAKGDWTGNLVYRRTARNFNQVMATAARTTVAEVEELVPAGGLHPDHVHTPGVYVKRIFQGLAYLKPNEKRTVRPRAAGAVSWRPKTRASSSTAAPPRGCVTASP